MWSETAAIASVPCSSSPLARTASIATIWQASAAFMSITPCPYTEPSISAPENGSVTLQPCDTGFVSMWPVITTRRPGPNSHLADRVRTPRQHRLQRDVVEPRRPHRRGEELRQRALVAEHARDPADLLHERHRAVEVHARPSTRGRPRRLPFSTSMTSLP